MEYVFTVFIGVLTAYIFALTVKEFSPYLSILSGLISRFRKPASVEVPEETPLKQRYDVDAFRNRIQYLKSQEDELLYDIKEPPPDDDYTGAEIIPLSAEIDIDNIAGRYV